MKIVTVRRSTSSFGPSSRNTVVAARASSFRAYSDDGTAGLAEMFAGGALTLVQRPSDAAFGDMPANALGSVDADVVGSTAELADALIGFVRDGVYARTLHAIRAAEPPTDFERSSEATEFSCPACGGVLSAAKRFGVTHFRCRTGHAYSPATLHSEQDRAIEEALYAAFRALIERADLSDRLADSAIARGHESSGRRFREQARLARERAATVEHVLENPHERQRSASNAADVSSP